MPPSKPPSHVVKPLDGFEWRISVGWGLVNGQIEPTRVTIAAISEIDAAGDVKQLPLTAERIRRLPLGEAISELRQSGAPKAYFERELQRLQSAVDEATPILSELDASRESIMETAQDLARLRGQDEDITIGDGGASAAKDLRHALDVSNRRLRDLGEARDAAIGPQKGRSRTTADHKAVAAVYFAAREAGESVTTAVAEYFNVSLSTAGKRIMAARKAGELEQVGRAR